MISASPSGQDDRQLVFGLSVTVLKAHHVLLKNPSLVVAVRKPTGKSRYLIFNSLITAIHIHASIPNARPNQKMIAKEELTSISQLLHLAHHRNKNQHRLSKWYKPFSILRRQLAKLITELHTLETAELYSTAPGKGVVGELENKYVVAARAKVEERVRFLRVRVLGDAYTYVAIL